MFNRDGIKCLMIRLLDWKNRENGKNIQYGACVDYGEITVRSYLIFNGCYSVY